MVFVSGQLLLAAGLVVILTLDMDVALRTSGSALWWFHGRREIRQLERGFNACRAVRVHDHGGVEVQDRTGTWFPASILPGSVSLQSLAWLRIQIHDGDKVVELLRGEVGQDQDWRRFRVLWRHVGAWL